MTQPFLEPPIYQLAGFQYSPTSGAIKNRQGNVVRLRAREANLLTALIDSFPEILSRQAIEEKLWKGSYATNATINQTIKALRFSLEDDQRALIRTIPKQGYVLSSKPHILDHETELPPLTATVSPDEADKGDDVTDNEEPHNPSPSLFSSNQWIALAAISLSLFMVAYLGVFHSGFDRISQKVGVHWVLFDATNQEIEKLNLSSDEPSIILKEQESYRICQEIEGVTLCKNQ